DRHRNPLVIDSELIYRASLVNYPSDVASASLGRDTVYVEEGRFRAVPVDRPVSSQEVATGEDAEVAPEPRNVGAADAAGTGAEPASTGPGPGRRPAAHPTPRAGQSAPARGRSVPRGGTPMVVAPPGSNVPPPPPPVEVTAPPSAEPETPPESMPEPT